MASVVPAAPASDGTTPEPGTEPAYVDVKGAAAQLGLSERGVRKRLDEGRFPGAVKTGRGWLIPAASLDAAPAKQPRETVPARPRTGAVDLAPLADAITQLTARVEALSAERAMWEARARTAEAQLAQLPASTPALEEREHTQMPDETTAAPVDASATPESGWAMLARLWQRLRGHT